MDTWSTMDGGAWPVQWRGQHSDARLKGELKAAVMRGALGAGARSLAARANATAAGAPCNHTRSGAPDAVDYVIGEVLEAARKFS